MNLTASQDKELCILETGCAVVHREGMDKAFLVQMDIQESGLKPVSNAEIHNVIRATKAEGDEEIATLIYAALSDNQYVVNILLDYNADPNITNIVAKIGREDTEKYPYQYSVTAIIEISSKKVCKV